MKAFVFGGAGLLGSTSAFLLAKEGLCDEIVLCDLFADKAKNHAMDMSQAVYAVSKTKITAGTLADMAGSGLVISGFSIPTTNPGAWTYDDTQRSLPVLRELAEALRTYAPNAVVVSMTNPLDAINYTLWKLSGLPRRQFIGFSFNDSLRMRWGIGNYLGICPQHIRCASMGEHGGQKVQIYSHVEIDGALRPFTEDEVRASDALQKSFWDEFYPLGALRTAGWTSAMGMLEVVEHIAGRRTGYVGCSCVLDGEYGLKDLSIGVPVDRGVRSERARARRLLRCGREHPEGHRPDLHRHGPRRRAVSGSGLALVKSSDPAGDQLSGRIFLSLSHCLCCRFGFAGRAR